MQVTEPKVENSDMDTITDITTMDTEKPRHGRR